MLEVLSRLPPRPRRAARWLGRDASFAKTSFAETSFAETSFANESSSWTTTAFSSSSARRRPTSATSSASSRRRGAPRDPRRRADLGPARGGDTRARPRTRGRSGCVRSGMPPCLSSGTRRVDYCRVFVETTSTYTSSAPSCRVPARSFITQSRIVEWHWESKKSKWVKKAIGQKPRSMTSLNDQFHR